MLTVAFSIYSLVLLVTLLVAGSLSDHLGRKPVIVATLAIQVASMALFLTADGIGGLLAARIVQGLSMGVVNDALSAPAGWSHAAAATLTTATAGVTAWRALVVNGGLKVGDPGTLAQSIKAARVGGHISLIGVLTGRAGDVPTAMLMARQQRLQGLIVSSRRHQMDLIRGIDAVHFGKIVVEF